MDSQPFFTIISGGQTGVDRAALDAALENNVPCGGWCPRGRKAEDGVISKRYPLSELQSPDYRQRTIRNVQSSDGTVIIYFGDLSGGTKLTADTCIRHDVPHLLLDGSVLTVEMAVAKLVDFLVDNQVNVLNVAGPRASNNPDAYPYAYEVIRRLVLAISKRETAEEADSESPGS